MALSVAAVPPDAAQQRCGGLQRGPLKLRLHLFDRDFPHPVGVRRVGMDRSCEIATAQPLLDRKGHLGERLAGAGTHDGGSDDPSLGIEHQPGEALRLAFGDRSVHVAVQHGSDRASGVR